MSDASPAQNVAPVDARCIRCGYDLRGLSQDRSCPECGLGIARSLALGQELHDSRPAWIASLAWGVRLVLVALLLPFLLFFVVNQSPDEWLPIVILLLSAILHALGAWLLTRPENPYATEQPLRWLSLALRVCAMGPVVAAAILFGIVTMRYWGYQSFALLPALLFLPCPVLELGLLRRLACRVFDEMLIEHSTIVTWGYVITAVLLWPILHSDIILGINSTSYLVLMLAESVSLSLFWLWSMFLMAYYSIAFSQAARKARATWQAADAALPEQPAEA